MSKDLWRRVEAAFSRLDDLRQSDMPHFALTSQLIAELSSALQELHVTTEELVEQNEELASSRRSLEEERCRYKELFEFAPDGYLVTDTEGKIREANSAALTLLNVDKYFLIGSPLTIFVHSDERLDFRNRLAQIKDKTDGKDMGWEITMLSRKRTPFPASITVGAVTTCRGGKGELRWLFRDISKRRQMEEELQKTDKLESLGILAGGLAHDFNNLLTVVLGNLSLSKMYPKGDEKVSKHLQEMENALRQTRSLTDQLLTFAKGGNPLTQAVSIDTIIVDVSAFALSGSKARCELSLPADLPPVEIDRGQITQVISNLLMNADQAMPDGGTIRICAEKGDVGSDNMSSLQPGEYIAVTITDEGIGIPKKQLAKIFDPYFTTKEQGNGLGLTISYSIVKKHGGHISVESEEEKGTIFTVYLPVSSDKLKNEIVDDALLSGEGKVLFMDDEEKVRQTAGEMLAFLGYEVEFAGDGAEAVRLFKEAFYAGRPYDAVITDLTVRGGMGGEKAVHELIKIDPKVKVIVSSGYSYDSLLSGYKKHGFCGVISKPYSLQELGEVLSRVLL